MNARCRINNVDTVEPVPEKNNSLCARCTGSKLTRGTRHAPQSDAANL